MLTPRPALCVCVTSSLGKTGVKTKAESQEKADDKMLKEVLVDVRLME